VAPSGIPWQFAVRAVAVVTGLTLLLIVDVHGVGFYLVVGDRARPAQRGSGDARVLAAGPRGARRATDVIARAHPGRTASGKRCGEE